MKRLPLLVSLPHAGLQVPREVKEYCILEAREIQRDGDEGAAAIYSDLQSRVSAFHTTPIARAIVDMNRAEDDRRKDGVVKTHTCWDVPIYGESPPEEIVEVLLRKYHRPYHERLTQLAQAGRVRLGIDCHTMAAQGPPVGPDPGSVRPWVCLSNAERTCPPHWIESMAECFGKAFGREISINKPFSGGYIIRSHAHELPWMQIELSRAVPPSDSEKRDGVLAALAEWCRAMPSLAAE